MLVRIVQSALVGLGCSMVSIPLLILGWQLYLEHLAHAPLGLGSVAGGLLPSMLVLAIAFVAGFAWNWRITRR
ncbi:MAG TPA: hypothetical protein VGF49_00045 [Candidatus Solibacter sp.]|jgi:hypothetical protein